MVCDTNQLTGFYVVGILPVNKLRDISFLFWARKYFQIPILTYLYLYT